MENLHEQLKAYIPKLERSIQAYMTQTPPSPNSAQGIMAMWECLTMLKAAEAGTCSEFTKADAEQWAQHMRNTDGSTGAHWSMEQTTSLAESLGVSRDEVSPWCWWIAVNMMYSDYYGVASRFGVATPEFFAELARAFLLDEDGPGPKPKMAAYYCGIVKGKN